MGLIVKYPSCILFNFFFNRPRSDKDQKSSTRLGKWMIHKSLSIYIYLFFFTQVAFGSIYPFQLWTFSCSSKTWQGNMISGKEAKLEKRNIFNSVRTL